MKETKKHHKISQSKWGQKLAIFNNNNDKNNIGEYTIESQPYI